MGKDSVDLLSHKWQSYVVDGGTERVISKGRPMPNYYSENWFDATEKFYKAAAPLGHLRWCVSKDTKYDIPYVMIGNGPHKVVINSGVHGIEGYFGSAAQNMFLTEFAPHFTNDIIDNYTVAIVHIINGWGMQNRMREVRDFTHDGALVDLNRNFGIDFSHPDKLPKNPKYDLAHELLLSKPDEIRKKNAIKAFRNAHMHDGVWAAISNGQYVHPYGLFYGGANQMTETGMTMKVYDDIMSGNAKSLTSIGLHTGLGRFWRKSGRVTGQLLVSHPMGHANTQFFDSLMSQNISIVPDESAIAGPTILGDLVDCLENRYKSRNIPIRTADFEIGTGEYPIMSPIYKRMDMGDARYDLLHYGKINQITWNHLTESWYPSDPGWRADALKHSTELFNSLVVGMKSGRMK